MTIGPVFDEKPRIRRALMASGLCWLCRGRGAIGTGNSPAEAFLDWMRGMRFVRRVGWWKQ